MRQRFCRLAAAIGNALLIIGCTDLIFHDLKRPREFTRRQRCIHRIVVFLKVAIGAIGHAAWSDDNGLWALKFCILKCAVHASRSIDHEQTRDHSQQNGRHSHGQIAQALFLLPLVIRYQGAVSFCRYGPEPFLIRQSPKKFSVRENAPSAWGRRDRVVTCLTAPEPMSSDRHSIRR